LINLKKHFKDNVHDSIPNVYNNVYDCDKVIDRLLNVSSEIISIRITRDIFMFWAIREDSTDEVF